ncbi:hypothetical protein [Endozoicomonas sp. OPT23]|uniref:hypothetical protein n=1 Tax=Endozoicomonas sp. OPT23 TaxID=2072845 RepID=UPI00129A23E6|nr:hypothetical protein [Endozoicomonas sp. OPT23]
MLVSERLKKNIGKAVVITCSVFGAATANLGWAEQSCFPTIDSKEPQYIVAVGSLMQTAARNKKLNKSEIEFPVWVRGYERGWFGRNFNRPPQRTMLAVRAEPGKKFNGLLLHSTSGVISSIDRGDLITCREKIDPRKLQSMTSEKLPDRGQFWIYTVKKPNNRKAASKFPIQQSEVDIFLTGCIEQAKQFNLPEFANQCVKSTYAWSEHWNNDRERPVAKLVTAKRPQVDKLLEQLEGGLFDRIRED